MTQGHRLVWSAQSVGWDQRRFAAPAHPDVSTFPEGGPALEARWAQPTICQAKPPRPPFSTGCSREPLGCDLGRDETGAIGIANAHSYVSFHQGNGASGQLESHQVGLYLLKQVGAMYLLGSANYGYNDLDVTRTVPGGTVQGDPIAHQFGTYAETGWSLDQGVVRFQPLAALQYQSLAQQGFAETGGPGALIVSGTQADSLRTHLGGRVAFAGLEDGAGRIWSPYVHGRWVAELLDNDRLVFAAINGAPVGGSFVAAGNGLGTHFGLFGAGLNVQLSDRWSAYSNYDLQVGRSLTAHTGSGSGGVAYAW